jgi:Tol biopolymer transport system component
VGSYSWSPLAAFVVYRLLDYSSNRELWIADPVSGAEFQLSSHGGAPEWSPDGGKIVYVGFDGIETINPDGTNRKVIISADTSRQMIGGPHWSPSGSHLTYLVIRLQGSPNTGTNEVYRATATGGGKTSLTKDTDWARPVAWR